MLETQSANLQSVLDTESTTSAEPLPKVCTNALTYTATTPTGAVHKVCHIILREGGGVGKMPQQWSYTLQHLCKNVRKF